VIRTLSIAAVLFCPSIAAASSLDRAAARIVEQLELPGVAGFDLKEHLAIAVIARSTPDVDAEPAMVKPLGSLLQSRLEQLGARSLSMVDNPPSSAEAERIAREAGAQWLLVVSVEPITRDVLRLWAEVKMVDRGLWLPEPRPGEATIYATAEESIRLDDTLRSLLARSDPRDPDPHPHPPDALHLDGAPMRIATVEDRVLALSACEIAGRSVLFLLDSKSFIAFTYEGGTLRRSGSIDLGKLPKASTVSRDPIGSIACGPSDKSERREVAFGSSALRSGQVLRVESRKTGEVALSFARTIDGVPLGYLAGGRLVLGSIDAGRSRWASPLAIEDKGRTVERSIRTGLVDLALEPAAPQGFRAVGVGTDYRLMRFTDDLEKSVPFGSSGVGVRIVGDGDSIVLVATSSASTADRDRVRLLAPDHGVLKRLDSIDVDGSVYATAIGALRAQDTRDLILAAYRPQERRTDILAIRLIAPRTTK
jgi:hypothetical protein